MLLGAALFTSLPPRVPLPRASSLVTFPWKSSAYVGLKLGDPCWKWLEMLWFARVLTTLSWKVSPKPWTLEGTGSGEGDSEGTVRIHCSPESCSVGSASLLLWSHCQRDDMHPPRGVGFRVSLIGQDAGRILSTVGLG